MDWNRSTWFKVWRYYGWTIKKESLGKEIILSLTTKGRLAFDMQDELHKKIETYFVNYLNDVSPEDIESFLKILETIEKFTVNFLSIEFQTSPP